MKTIRTIAGVVLISLVAFLNFSCGINFANHSPKKPMSVPSGAAWAGGVDGGYWVNCAFQPLASSQQFICSVYSERGDCVLADGVFEPYKVNWDAQAKSASYEKTSLVSTDLRLSGFDRGMIRLENNLVLRNSDIE